MALDGLAVSAIIYELDKMLTGGRIDKITQPLNDEIIFSVRSLGGNYKVLMSANSNNPRLHITETKKPNPDKAPLFCMVLRKHLAGGKITGFSRPGFERVINIHVDSTNEMGDRTNKTLSIEIMGKHSNIILIDENGRIIDSIKHISHDTSSVREVLPGKAYSLPPSQDKLDPRELEKDAFLSIAKEKSGSKYQNIIYQSYTGIAPQSAAEICIRAGVDPSDCPDSSPEGTSEKLFDVFSDYMEQIKENRFSYEMITNNGNVSDFSVTEAKRFPMDCRTPFETISSLLESFYKDRDNAYHIKQKAYDTRKVVSTNIDRCIKKKEILIKTVKETEEMEMWRLYGELITANIYAVKKGINTFRTYNFYDENMAEIDIPLDPTKTPSENAQSYFSKYAKAKRTLEAVAVQEKQNDAELEYLERVLSFIDLADTENDIKEIRQELAGTGYIKDRSMKGKNAKPVKSKPMHFISSDGYHIYVGKNNTQNDELTFKLSERTDLWLHVKDMPGSHVIISLGNVQGTEDDIPDTALLEAANLAVLNSAAKDSTLVAVDYTFRRNIKKPSGSKPGFVVYETNYTLYITPDKDKIPEQIK
ncbi:MAG: NFACT family protein [Firmicutes bacterium]|nr:NFACT family protein [Bacillota bacterium]